MTYDEYCESTNPLCADCLERASDVVVGTTPLCGDCDRMRQENDDANV